MYKIFYTNILSFQIHEHEISPLFKSSVTFLRDVI